MPLNPDQLNNLAVAADAAVLSEIHTHCPALLAICQWALESGWGSHQPGCNCFGIKHYTGAYGRQDLMTVEYLDGKKCSIPQPFATFPTLYDCFEKHGELISGNARYAPAFTQFRKDKDIAKLVYGIGPIYATDPGYANEILKIMTMPDVLKAIGDAWDRINPKAAA